MRILVVDDNRDAADASALHLRCAGHQAEAAYGAAQAIEAVERQGPWDALMIDQWLQPGPIDGGTRLLARLRDAGHRMPAAILTAIGIEAFAEASRAAESLGRAICVRKPADAVRVANVLAGMGGDLPEGP